VFVPQRTTGSLCSDAVADEALFFSLLKFLKRWAVTQIDFQVYSSPLNRLIDELDNHGARLATSVPRISARTASHWNTKLGGARLFDYVPSARSCRPPWTIVHSEKEVENLVRHLRGNQSLVVKANHSMGGSGIRHVTKRNSFEALRTAKPGKRLAGKESADEGWPRLAEIFVGSADGNRSVTCDFKVDAGGVVEGIGVGEQLLDDGFSYRGCHSLESELPSATHTRIAHVGHELGAEMCRRGYHGPFNLDFVVTQENDLFLMEMNVRKSAPLDQFLVASRLTSSLGRSVMFYAREDVRITNWSAATQILQFGYRPTNDSMREGGTTSGALILAIYNGISDESACVFGFGDTLRDSRQSFESVSHILGTSASATPR
jgi:hypothetical protein